MELQILVIQGVNLFKALLLPAVYVGEVLHRAKMLFALDSLAESCAGEGTIVLDKATDSSATVKESVAACSGKRRSGKARSGKKQHGKQKGSRESHATAPDSSVAVNQGSGSVGRALGPSKEYGKNEDHNCKVGVLEQRADSVCDSAFATFRPGITKDVSDPYVENKDRVHTTPKLDEQFPKKRNMQWGLRVEVERGAEDTSFNERTPRGRHKVAVRAFGSDQPLSSPGSHHPSPNQSPKSVWKQKTSESRRHHESPRSAEGSQPLSPELSRVDGNKSEGLSEWNRIKVMQQNVGAEVSSHKDWVPKKSITRPGDGRDSNRGRGKGKQARVEQSSQVKPTSNAKDLARQKFEADLRLKQEELLQRSKQTLKAEFQRAKRIELSRKGRDELEAQLERNLVYFSGELIYLNI